MRVAIFDDLETTESETGERSAEDVELLCGSDEDGQDQEWIHQIHCKNWVPVSKKNVVLRKNVLFPALKEKNLTKIFFNSKAK